MDLEFPSLTRDDFPRVARWLHEPHVDAWWRQPLDLEGVEAKLGPRVDGREPTRMHLIRLDGDPIGWIQWYRWADYPEHAARLGAGERTAGLDLAIGDVSAIGRGVGTRVIVTFVRRVFDEPDIAAIVCDPEEANRRSVRAFARAGFTTERVCVLDGEATPRRIVRLERASLSSVAGAPDREQV
jgi:aminoglycoside 6'-N-acetyltransferase